MTLKDRQNLTDQLEQIIDLRMSELPDEERSDLVDHLQDIGMDLAMGNQPRGRFDIILNHSGAVEHIAILSSCLSMMRALDKIAEQEIHSN